MHDRAAIVLKNRSIRFRTVVLLLGFAASTLAVLMGYFQPYLAQSFDHVYPFIYASIPFIPIFLLLWGIFNLNRQIQEKAPRPQSEQRQAQLQEEAPRPQSERRRAQLQGTQIIYYGFLLIALLMLVTAVFQTLFRPQSGIIYAFAAGASLLLTFWLVDRIDRLNRQIAGNPAGRASETASKDAVVSAVTEPPRAAPPAVPVSANDEPFVLNRRITRAVFYIALIALIMFEVLILQYATAELDKLSWITVLELLRLVLFLLPIISAGIVAYTAEFLPSMQWAKYRISAEAIRREMFMYRGGAAHIVDKVEYKYNDPDPKVRREALQKRLIAIEDAEGDPVSLFAKEPTEEDLTASIRGTSEKGDDGFSRFSDADNTAENYVKWRLESQRKWYLDKSNYEHKHYQRWRVVALIIGGAGSLLTLLGNGSWVAVTTSAAITVTGLTAVQMQGRTYRLYNQTANLLKRRKWQWDIDTRAGNAKVADLIFNTEGEFEKEIGTWYEQAKTADDQASNPETNE